MMEVNNQNDLQFVLLEVKHTCYNLVLEVASWWFEQLEDKKSTSLSFGAAVVKQYYN